MMWLSASIRDVMSWIRGVGLAQVQQGYTEEVLLHELKSSSRGRMKGKRVRAGVMDGFVPLYIYGIEMTYI